MAETLLLPVVRGVVGKAGDALVKRVTRMWGVDDDRDRLERRLAYVQSLLADAEYKSETNPAVGTWMKALKAAAYRADDVLDDFEYEALRLEAQSRGSMASKKVLSCFNFQNKVVFRHKASKELKKVLDKIEELVEEMNKFGLVAREEVPQVPYHRQTHSALDESAEIFGRDNDKEAVVNLLLNPKDKQSVQVLPIIGMGGLGKTTLAKMVFNDPRVQKQFELKMWYCVSENFEATAVVRSVIELATNGRCELPDNIELLRGRLQEVIGRKRFLLVLDDVWNEDERKWEDDLKPLLCSSSHGSGSMIVVTSRSQRVASIMGTHSPYELVCLNEDDSWKLFSKKAFCTEAEEHTELVAIGRRIVSKCKGLPLALKTMGGLMSSTQQVQDWVTVADSNIRDTSRGKDEVMHVLKLSYRYLTPEMKQCFAFCSIFPKDYVMQKDKLIQLWIANSFIHVEGMKNLTKKGEEIFDELVWRSFLQDVKEHNFCTLYRPILPEIGCKMHDLMHDLATEVTEECGPAQKSIQEKKDIHHMKISSHELKEIKGLLKSTSSLRTLFTDESVYQDLIEINLMSVRALCCRKPSDSLGKHAKYLRYLDLSGSNIVRLSDSICMMYHLQSLRLDQCGGLQYLPEGMAISLRNLIHIHLKECWNLQHMPPKLSLLQNLHTLTRFVVDTKDGCGIEELKDLRQLGNRLELYKLKNVKNGSRANLHEKQISELLLDWGHPCVKFDFRRPIEDNNAEEVLESLVPCGELKVLDVHGYPGRAISQWMRNPKMFQCLRKLTMQSCQKCTDIPIVWLSRSLESLDLANMDNLTTLCKNIDVQAVGSNSSPPIFPSLKSMSLSMLRNLERWAESSAGEPHRSVMFPRLEELTIHDCPKLGTLPLAPLLTTLVHAKSYLRERYLPVSMPLCSWPSLVSLTVGWSVNVPKSLWGQQGQSLNPPEALRCLRTASDDGFVSIFDMTRLQVGLGSALAFVEKLEIFWCNNIVRWPLEELRYLPHLQSLIIVSCEKLGEEGSSSQEVLPLPLLKDLEVKICDSLLEIPQLPTSLERMVIQGCKSLVALPSNLGNLAELRDFTVSCCGTLRALPDGMDGLTSLEDLIFCDCPGIERFPQGLSQRLPALKYLGIYECPNLQRRCREGGEYFDLVSSIPDKLIPAASEPEIKKSVKRFPPFCGGN
ncbi:hypothetical protein EJB05_47881, partial [Eragrostis curvula]